MYIGTDKQCLISPYISVKKYNKQSFLLEIDAESKYAGVLQDVFREMIFRKTPINWAD